jgi:hypothetical protein
VLRLRNAGPNTASDHLRVLDLALEQLGQVDAAGPIVARTATAGATDQFSDELRETHINFVMGYDVTEPVREAILTLPESAWTPAIGQDSAPREAAWAAEIRHRVDLSAWPEGSRPIVRRERHHPGAQLRFRTTTRIVSWSATATGANLNLHRARVTAEDRIRAAKQTGLANLPFRDFDQRRVT